MRLQHKSVWPISSLSMNISGLLGNIDNVLFCCQWRPLQHLFFFLDVGYVCDRFLREQSHGLQMFECNLSLPALLPCQQSSTNLLTDSTFSVCATFSRLRSQPCTPLSLASFSFLPALFALLAIDQFCLPLCY